LQFSKLEIPETFYVNFQTSETKSVNSQNFSDFSPKDKIRQLMILKGPLVIIFHILNVQGLVLIFYESWGTETANFENFVRFSSVFTHFASKAYKTQF
jgi:hypothetical protein